MKLRTIAEALECRIEGDPDLEISGVAGLEEAVRGELTFSQIPAMQRSQRRPRHPLCWQRLLSKGWK